MKKAAPQQRIKKVATATFFEERLCIFCYQLKLTAENFPPDRQSRSIRIQSEGLQAR